MDRDRLFEYVCQAEVEEVNGAFTREERTWYPGSEKAPPVQMPPAARPLVTRLRREPVANLRRMPDGKPDLEGFYESSSRGANQGLERRGGRGWRLPSLSIRPDGKLPMQPWADGGKSQPEPYRTRL